ncbi:hypothetical protein J1614_012148 [Plenodomus biglobosus]|nr:hypothetical protein J1614_012148 [Plenodomus biglobosus]
MLLVFPGLWPVPLDLRNSVQTAAMPPMKNIFCPTDSPSADPPAAAATNPGIVALVESDV